MFDIKIKLDECIIPTEQLVDLLNCKLDALKEAQEKDSSWNYPIEELQMQINELKLSL